MGVKNKKKLAIIGGAATVVVLGVVFGVVIWQVTKDKDDAEPVIDPVDPWKSDSPLGVYENAAVACDAPECATIARDILQEKNGTVADAAIAALLCMGIMHAQSSGIGGGFIAVIYDREGMNSSVINAREVAPALATEDMYGGNSTLSQRGGLAVAVPGEMKGLWHMYKTFGSFNRPEGPRWNELLEPTIALCENGFTIDNSLGNAIRGKAEFLRDTPSMAEIFINPETNELYKAGEKMKRPQLAATLKLIANDSENGGDLLYDRDSDLAQKLAQDLGELESIITIEDLHNYTLYTPDPIVVKIRNNMTVHAVPPPGSGVLTAFMLRLLSEFDLPSSLSTSGEETIRAYQLIVEAFKHAFAKRTLIGDPNEAVGDEKVTEIVKELVADLTSNDDLLETIKSLIREDTTNQTYEYYGADFYAPEDHGTAHLSIVDQYGNAIAVTSTVNLHFGAVIRSNQTGIILNDEMDDFSAPNITNYFGVPPSPNNFIVPGKRPMSSMTPLIVTDRDGNVRLAVGAAGGTRITSAVAYVTMRNLWFGENIKQAIDARRLHHQLAPMNLYYETGFYQNITDGLAKIGHNVTEQAVGDSVTGGVALDSDGKLNANCDFRKGGSVAGF